MTHHDQPHGSGADTLAELIATMSEQGDGTPAGVESDPDTVSRRVEVLLQALTKAVYDGWPTVEELKGLAPGEYSTLVRELGVHIDRLTALRFELLSGRGPRLR